MIPLNPGDPHCGEIIWLVSSGEHSRLLKRYEASTLRQLAFTIPRAQWQPLSDSGGLPPSMRHPPYGECLPHVAMGLSAGDASHKTMHISQTSSSGSLTSLLRTADTRSPLLRLSLDAILGHHLMMQQRCCSSSILPSQIWIIS